MTRLTQRGRRLSFSREFLYSVKLSKAGEAILRNRSVVFIWALCSAWGLGVADVAAQTPTVQSIRSESFEGPWAKTKGECLDEEGPNSRTMIDLRNVVGGKSTPMPPASHCLPVRPSTGSHYSRRSATPRAGCGTSQDKTADNLARPQSLANAARSGHRRLALGRTSWSLEHTAR